MQRDVSSILINYTNLKSNLWKITGVSQTEEKSFFFSFTWNLNTF